MRTLIELTKPRIVVLVMVTVAAAFYLGADGAFRLDLMVHTLFGTALVAGGTNALNQIAEADVDARMRRTKGRPLPSGRLEPRPARALAWTLGLGGVLYLAGLVNLITAGIAALTLVSYVFLYTPLKRRTSLSTLVGAIPGALPVVGGWAAAREGLPGLEAWVLFAIMFLWQLPHFLALAWIYRDEYRAAGLKMLSVGDELGRITFRQAGLASVALVSVALTPTLIGLTGAMYFWGALVLSLWFVWAAASTAWSPTLARAWRLFRVSVAYLPVLLVLMVMDKVR